MGLQFVTFYADGGKSRPVIPGDLDGPAQINLLVRSVRKTHNGASFTILSDEFTDLTGVPPDVAVERYKIDLSIIMYERMRVQFEFLKKSLALSPVILLDTDVLVSGSLSELFTRDFDVAFTWRQSDEMPINGGVIYINSARPEVAVRIFGTILRNYAEKYAGTSAWYGDQFAILNVLNLPFPEIYKSPTIERIGGKIALLDCNHYNCTPNGDRPNLSEFSPEVKVYHFKGMGRRIMSKFWDLQLSDGRPRKFLRNIKIFYYNLQFRLNRRSYLSQLRRDTKRFNCGEQNDAAWVDRAEIAARLVSRAVAGRGPVAISDVGCGDRKLQAALIREGLQIAYRGYDLLPQADDVHKFDIDNDTLPSSEIAAVLGVLEYSVDVAKPLKMLAGAVKFLVVSHAVSDYRNMTASSLRKVNWKTYLSRAEFEEVLVQNGFRIIGTEITSNQKTVVWLCESSST